MAGQVLGDRYEVQQQLGRNAGRRTLLARDLATQELVVIKLLSFGSDFEWDALKLFEREAETLKALSHPAIPRYLDYLELDSSYGKGFALIQTYVAGKSLEGHLKAGRTFTELEVRQLAKDLLEILIYLHGRQPLVIHRDIKPSNILLTNRSGNSVGQVYLVDFGSVQTLAAKEGGTMTVVGTYGYMPPEQFGGRATPASDLYSLGATVIYLVTGMHPADLPQKDLQIQFKQAANLSPAFASWLKWMTQPSLDKRLTSAQEALQVLEQEQQRDTAPLSDRKPIGSTVLLTKNADSLEILTRSMRVGIRRHRPHNPRLWDTVMAMSIAVFSVVFQKLPLLMCSILISGLITLLFARFSRTRLHIDQQQISLTQELFGFKHNLLRPARRQDILMLNRTREVEQIPFETKVYIKPGIILWVGTQKIEIGSDGLLTEPEINWLAQELSDWLGLPITKD